jgi:hypothetical protein
MVLALILKRGTALLLDLAAVKAAAGLRLHSCA